MKKQSPQNDTLAHSHPSPVPGIAGCDGLAGAFDHMDKAVKEHSALALGIGLLNGKHANTVCGCDPELFATDHAHIISALRAAAPFADDDEPLIKVNAALSEPDSCALANSLFDEATRAKNPDAALARQLHALQDCREARRMRSELEQTLRDIAKCGPRTTRERIAELVNRLDQIEAVMTKAAGDWMTEGYTAHKLSERDIPPVRWIVPGLVPAGLTILAAKRKRGKSWLALALGMDLSGIIGRTLAAYDIEGGERVLYLALEDNERRMKERMQKMGGTPSGALHIFHDWPRIGRGCMERLDAWMGAHPDTRLVIVDVLQKIRPPTARGADPYQADYDAMGELHKFARTHNIAVLVIHHCRKADGDDVFDSVSGTGGITGCADSIMVLQRAAGSPNGTLWITGRDVEEQEIAMTFSPDTCRWRVDGAAGEVRMSDARRRIIDLLKDEGVPMTTTAIAKALGESYDSAKKCLQRMADAGQVNRAEGGGYSI